MLKMKEFEHHPGISAYDHSIRVTKKAAEIVIRHHRKVNWDDLLLAALLHDFYLYDFKTKTSFKNGIIHPLKAAENAKELFNANEHVQKCIKTHMFPTVFWRIPTSREAWILSIADKKVSIKEFFKRKQYQQENN